jgi:hypothetical protein
MAVADPAKVQLLFVTFPDSVDMRRWVVVAGRNDALKTALRCAPIGSVAQLAEERLSLDRLVEMNLRLGDVRDLGVVDSECTLAAEALA